MYTLLRDYQNNAFGAKTAWNVDLLEYVFLDTPSFAKQTSTMRLVCSRS